MNTLPVTVKRKNFLFQIKNKSMVKTVFPEGKLQREFWQLVGLMNRKYGLSVFFASNEDLLRFNSFLNSKKIHYIQMRIKSSFLKLYAENYSIVSFLKGGTIYYAFTTREELYSAVFYFFHDNLVKDIFSKGFLIKDFYTKLNSMVGNIISVKLLDYFFSFNYSFLKFFLFSNEFLKQNSHYFLFCFIKITMVIFYSIMLILALYKVMFFRFWAIMMRSFVFVTTTYANKKSIA